MNEPQVWTLIGVFAIMMFAFTRIITKNLVSIISAKFETVNERIDGLKTEMVLRFDRVDVQFEQVDRRFEQVDRRFDQVESRIEKVEVRLGKIETRVDDIDRDVQAISRKVFPE